MYRRKALQHIYLIITLGFCFTQNACKSQDDNNLPTASRELAVEQRATAFFETFAARSDWQKFCSFYRKDLIFDDITLQIHLDSLWQFKSFYNWESEVGNFHKMSPDQDHLSVETLVANDSVAVARGHLNPFYYYDELVDVDWGMDFTIWLYFDDALMIRKQVDWFEYDPAVLEGVVKHYREKGAGVLPDWLKLSRE
ncbi:MAG: hypothetical protein R2824_32135 [Saprospiraceae bacterium]|nr:hypothetical protein [Lewinella sp.]